jgi:hypothetical protein
MCQGYRWFADSSLSQSVQLWLLLTFSFVSHTDIFSWTTYFSHENLQE